MNELRHALRTLRRRPGFAQASVLTLALGIGGSTAIFSVVHAVLLKPLPSMGRSDRTGWTRSCGARARPWWRRDTPSAWRASRLEPGKALAAD